MNSEIVFNIDQDAASMFIMKVYPQKPALLWEHFSQSEKLDQWWAPSPWKCQTSEFNFIPDGKWKYAMIGPDGQKESAEVLFTDITSHRSISWKDYFVDVDGNIITDFPQVRWLIGFTGIEEGTKITINLELDSTEELNKIIEMGFEKGFKTGLNQLEQILKNNNFS